MQAARTAVAKELPSRAALQYFRRALALVFAVIPLEEIGVVHHVHVGHGPGLYVLESARAEGAARALLDEVESRARGRDCHALVLESGYRDAEGHADYQRRRMRDVAKQFRLVLNK